MRGEKWHWRNSHHLRRFQHTPGTYHGTLKHLFMKGIRSYLDFWNIWGYVPGVCWNLLRLDTPWLFKLPEAPKFRVVFRGWKTLPNAKKRGARSFFRAAKTMNTNSYVEQHPERTNECWYMQIYYIWMYIYILVVYEVSERVVHNRIDGYVLLEKEIWEQTLCT